MHVLLEFLITETAIAFFVALSIFLLTIFLVIRQWIGVPITFFLLIFAITIGLTISNYHILKSYLNDYEQARLTEEGSDSLFKKQVTQAVQDVKTEVKLEKENLHYLMNQVEEMVDQMDKQKQKLQQFIEDAREQFLIDKNKESNSNTIDENQLSQQ